MSESDPYSQQLMHPNWQVVEAHFGVAMPQILKEYYADPAKILQEDYGLETPLEIEGKKRIRVYSFSPITARSISHFGPDFDRFLDIADDGGEAAYFIDPREQDPQVLLFSLETYDLFPTGLSLSEFLTNRRLEHQRDD